MTGAYVSCKKTMQKIVLMELRIRINQNVHRQESVSVMNPPIIGPTAGPRYQKVSGGDIPVRGPRRYQPTTLVRSRASYMSLIVPPPFEILALPKSPDMKRKPISMLMLVDRAQPICVKVNIVKPTI
jgi:hypothetical protein